jgi:transcriptional regulator with XRE-family HTH domain
MDLKTARLSRNLTQEQLEERSGIAQTTISAIECGSLKKPSWETVCRLARVLDYAPEQIFPVDSQVAS